jgi:hypothetical protein
MRARACALIDFSENDVKKEHKKIKYINSVNKIV